MSHFEALQKDEGKSVFGRTVVVAMILTLWLLIRVLALILMT